MTASGTGVLVLFAAAAMIGATALRPDSGTAFLLTSYILLTALVVTSLNTLSLESLVRLEPLLAIGLAWIGLATVAWACFGRPRLHIGIDLAEVRRDRIVVTLAAIVLVAVLYEGFLVATTVPNTWDSLTYHLARVAAWYQEGGVHWIQNATGRQNEFPPGAELLVLFTVVVTGGDRFAELPQFAAQLALMGGIFGIARRLDFALPAALFAAFAFATLSEIALQSTTTQTDLVVASYLVAFVYFILGGTTRELALAGVAFGLAAATKQTTFFALPGLIVIAIAALPRRRLLPLGMSCALGFALIGSWGYVRNVVQTGHVLGEGSGRVEHQAHLGVGALATVARVAYRFLDLSGFSPATVAWMSVVGVIIAAVLALRSRARGPKGIEPRLIVVALFTLTGPLALALLASGIGLLAELLELPINPPATTSGAFHWGINPLANEDYSYFGPLGALVLVPVIAAVIWRWRGATDRRPAALALALPLFLVALALVYRFNPFIGRFMVVPVALAAPLLARVRAHDRLALGVVGLGATTLFLAHANNDLKPVTNEPIWTLGRGASFSLNGGPKLGRAVTELDAALGPRGEVGAVLGVDDAAYPLFGPALDRRVRYLPATDPVRSAEAAGLSAVVVGPKASARAFRVAATWTVVPVGRGYWRVAHRHRVTSSDSAGRPGSHSHPWRP